MKRSKRPIISSLLVAGFLLFTNCYHETLVGTRNDRIVLEASDRAINASHEIRYLTTASDTPFERIRSLPDGDWTVNGLSAFNVGFSSSTYWLKLPLLNPIEGRKWYVTLQNTRLDLVDFYLLRETDGIVIHRESGDYRPLGPEAETSVPLFHFPMKPDENATLYIKIRSETHISFPLRFMTTRAFSAEKARVNFIQILFVAVFLLYLVLQSLLNPYMNLSSQLYLGLGVILAFAYGLMMVGDANLLLWPDQIFLKNHLHFGFLLASGFFYLRFFQEFFRTNELSISLHRFGMLMQILFAAMFVLIWTGLTNKPISVLTLSLFSLAYVYLTLGLILSLKRRRYWVLFFLPTVVLAPVALFFQVLMYGGILPYNFFFEWSSIFIHLIESFFPLISLIYRHRSLKIERDHLREQLNQLLLQQKADVFTDENDGKEPPSKSIPSSIKRTRNLNHSEIVKRIIHLLTEEKPYLDAEYGLADLSRDLGIRIDQVSTILSQELDTSFPEIIGEFRVREACRLMVEKTDMNLLEIAYESGFGSRSTFNRVFRQIKDIPPIEYRRELQRSSRLH